MPWVVKEDKKLPSIPKIKVYRRRADKRPGENEWEKVHEIADRNEKRFIDIVIGVTNRTKEGTDRERLKASYLNGNMNGVYNSIPIEEVYRVELIEDSFLIIRDTFNEAGEVMILELPPGFRGFKFNSEETRGLDWINTRAVELVSNVTMETMLAIREEIRIAYIEGVGVDEIADNIVDIIGLTRRHARAVNRYRNTLLEAGASIGRANRMSKEYANRLLRWRAENIARTEVMTAANQGHLEMMKQAAEHGIIDLGSTRKEWIVTPDDRLCQYCEPMDGVRADIDELFDTPLGRSAAPPLHPQCRCVMGTVFLD